MSYCRWSSDNFKSAVYVYESERGYETHVSAFKLDVNCPYPDPLSSPTIDLMQTDREEWLRLYRQNREWHDESSSVPHGLPHDGESFLDDTPGECAARLRSLSEMGYHVPDGVIESLEEEQNDAL